MEYEARLEVGRDGDKNSEVRRQQAAGRGQFAESSSDSADRIFG